MQIIDCIQGEPEWHAARCGRVTASRIVDIMAKTKTGPSASRKNYAAEIVTERLTGCPAESGFVSPAMKWGTEQEPLARRNYAFMHDVTPVQVGFVIHPKMPMAGASPDSLIGEDGLLEIKCPNTATHIETLLGASIDGSYLKQMQWQMACTGREWCDFISFDPRLPAEMQMDVRRVRRDTAMIREIEVEVQMFLGEVDATVKKLRSKFGLQQAAE